MILISRYYICTYSVLLGFMSSKKKAYDDAEVNDAYPWLDYAKNVLKMLRPTTIL